MELIDDFRYYADRHLDEMDFRRLAAGEMSDEEEMTAAHHLDECPQCQLLARRVIAKKKPQSVRTEAKPQKTE